MTKVSNWYFGFSRDGSRAAGRSAAAPAGVSARRSARARFGGRRPRQLRFDRDGDADVAAELARQRVHDHRAQLGVEHLAGEVVGSRQHRGVLDQRERPGQPHPGPVLRRQHVVVRDPRSPGSRPLRGRGRLLRHRTLPAIPCTCSPMFAANELLRGRHAASPSVVHTRSTDCGPCDGHRWPARRRTRIRLHRRTRHGACAAAVGRTGEEPVARTLTAAGRAAASGSPQPATNLWSMLGVSP